MVDGEDCEEPENKGPYNDKEKENQEDNGPGGRVLAGPEVLPVATEGGREEVILEDHGDEEPLAEVILVSNVGDRVPSGDGARTNHDDFSTIDGSVE